MENALIKWDEIGERLFETGIDRGVLYVRDNQGEYPEGVAWNGLQSVNEAPTGAEATPIYADNIKYLELTSNEEFEATIEAFTYPDEFEECDGSKELAPGVLIGQQRRVPFGMSYRTLVGNDVDDIEHGYKLHLIYGAKASPSDTSRQTINETPEAVTFSWGITTTPVPVTGAKPTAKMTIDSTKVDADKMAALEAILYGNGSDNARLPLPDEVLSIIKE